MSHQTKLEKIEEEAESKINLLIENGYIDESDKERRINLYVEKQKLINSKDKGVVLPTHTPSKQ
tara:strand:+ start:67 stop:258 length:192 start_codon:yes stop_codon:yes gene_type:complete